MNFKEFKNSISKFRPEEIAFVGLGNNNMGDDSAGMLLLDYLNHQKEFCNSHFINAGINPENYLQKIIDYAPSLIVFIDAIRSEKCGEIIWLDSKIIDDSGISTHAYSIKLVEEYLSMHIKSEVKYLCITARTFCPGNKISDELVLAFSSFFGNKESGYV